jgi:hypothetical protein
MILAISKARESLARKQWMKQGKSKAVACGHGEFWIETAASIVEVRDDELKAGETNNHRQKRLRTCHASCYWVQLQLSSLISGRVRLLLCIYIWCMPTCQRQGMQQAAMHVKYGIPLKKLHTERIKWRRHASAYIGTTTCMFFLQTKKLQAFHLSQG